MAEALPRVVRWRDWSGFGFEHLLLIQNGDFIEVKSAVICGPDNSAPDGFAALYSLKLNADWCVVELAASVLGNSDFVHLRRTDNNRWLGKNDEVLRTLDQALDVDLSITPFTNTIAIRRLGLAIGESTEITAAYLAFPQLAVSTDAQRYTRLASDRYRYESMDTDFVREITVDEHGLVMTYPKLFRRA